MYLSFHSPLHLYILDLSLSRTSSSYSPVTTGISGRSTFFQFPTTSSYGSKSESSPESTSYYFSFFQAIKLKLYKKLQILKYNSYKYHCKYSRFNMINIPISQKVNMEFLIQLGLIYVTFTFTALKADERAVKADEMAVKADEMAVKADEMTGNLNLKGPRQLYSKKRYNSVTQSPQYNKNIHKQYRHQFKQQIPHIMLKPKTHLLKLKFHLSKVQAANNKVNSKVHAYIHIDNQQLQFKEAPQLKKNVAVFGSDLEYDNFMINCDQITGLYEQKKVLLVIQFQTQGAYIKIGQVSINVGQILNQKKYRVVNVYPLSKCYDKSAKAKLAVDFIPMSQKRDNINSNKNPSTNFKQSSLTVQRRQQISTSQVNNLSGSRTIGFYKNPTIAIKSRLAQQQNVILQQKVYQYEKRMDNYRIAQSQVSQRMQEQIQRKDEKISQLSMQVNKQQNKIHLITLENESFKSQFRAVNEQVQVLKLQARSHQSTIQNLQKALHSKEKQLQSKNITIQNLSRTKQNKQKHLSLQIQKYTSKYSQSQQQRNKIIFQLQNKVKVQLQKKDQHYQQLIKVNQTKYLQSMKTVRQRNKFLETGFKQTEQLSQQKDTRIKSLGLELSNSQSIAQQQEEQMTHLNQQFSKQKKQRQALSHQLESLSFSYKQILGQLQGQKQLVKQITRKNQIARTELSLSNQTVQQQRQRIIIMNKKIQIHEEREYYMKQHYEEQLYDRQTSENNVRGQRGQLQAQVKRYREQLKLAEEKYQEQRAMVEMIRSSLQSLERQLTVRNASLMRLGEEKIHSDTEGRKARQLASELEQQLCRLQQQKAYLSQALMQKKVTIDNDKSIEWTYKIESLQNDIHQIVQKFKTQKEQLKQHSRRQQTKRLEQIGRLKQQNKMLRGDADDLRQKLSKRDIYSVSVQKALKSQRERNLDVQMQLSSERQSCRLLSNEKQVMTRNLEQADRVTESKQRQIGQIQRKLEKHRKDLGQMKNGFNNLISLILQCVIKRYNQRVNFQDISLDQAFEAQIVGYVNVALRKFSDDHNKTRQLIRQLEEYQRMSMGNGESSSLASVIRKNNLINASVGQNANQQYNRRFQNSEYQNKHKANNHDMQQSIYNPTRKTYAGRNVHPSSSPNRTFPPHHTLPPFSNEPAYQVQTYRHQQDRLKRQQSQYKVKIKALEEQVQKHERQHDSERLQQARLKNQLEQVQDEVARVNFTLRKKMKIVSQIQGEMNELQKENFQLKANHSCPPEKARQKTSSPSQQNQSLPFIKDLQSKLTLRSQQLSLVQKQLQSLKQQYLTELSLIKKLQNKLKEKNNKTVFLQQQLQSQSSKRVDDKDREIMRLKKGLNQQTQQREGMQERIRQLQNVIKEFQLQVSHQQNRNRQLHEQIKLTEVQLRRELQSNDYRLNDQATFYQTEVMQYRSQLSQQRDKCQQLIQKNSHLNLSLAKSVKELQLIKQKISCKQKQLMMSQEQFQQLKDNMALRISDLMDKIRELQVLLEAKSYQLEECRFTYEGRVLELQRQIDQVRDGLLAGGSNGR